MKKLFGTDGIRGIANKYPITCEMAVNIGRAAASYFKKNFSKNKDKTKIIIGKDTRISGDMLEHALVAGICSAGADAYLTGILPTPGIAYITSSTGSDAGVVISASHNPFYDNGIKFFDKNGYKLSDKKEYELEKLVLNSNIESLTTSIRNTGSVYKIDCPKDKYSVFLKDATAGGCSFKGMKIVIDCSNGATYKIAPEIFAGLGADVIPLFIDPDGKNINKNCGSQNTEICAKKVVETGADAGLAFDGDGDRLVAVDEKGFVLTGDQILAVLAKYMKSRKILENDLVVSTVMSNMGLSIALKDMGIKHIMAQVGDRNVMEKMIAYDSVLGGEDSGHTILLNHHTTGDGILTALKLMEIVKIEAKPLSELSEIMTVLPQVLINVDVKSKPDIKKFPEIITAVKSVEKKLDGKGRTLIRYSGTQPVCRIMVEGPTIEKTRKYCRQIADVVFEKLG